MSNQVYAGPNPINPIYVDQRLNLLEATITPGVGTNNKIAFYNSLGTLDDSNITSDGVNLTLLNTAILSVNSIQSVSGPLDLTATGTITEDTTGQINIGTTTATGVTLGRNGTNVNVPAGGTLVTNSIDSLLPSSLFANSPFVTFGNGAGGVQLNCPLSWAASGPAGIDSYYIERNFAVTASGPIPAGSASWGFNRIGSMVTGVIKWLSPDIPVIANAILTFSPNLPAPFIPNSVHVFACEVRTNGATMELGNVSINTVGTISVGPSATTVWTIGQLLRMNSICFSYDILL